MDDWDKFLETRVDELDGISGNYVDGAGDVIPDNGAIDVDDTTIEQDATTPQSFYEGKVYKNVTIDADVTWTIDDVGTALNNAGPVIIRIAGDLNISAKWTFEIAGAANPTIIEQNRMRYGDDGGDATSINHGGGGAAGVFNDGGDGGTGTGGGAAGAGGELKDNADGLDEIMILRWMGSALQSMAGLMAFGASQLGTCARFGGMWFTATQPPAEGAPMVFIIVSGNINVTAGGQIITKAQTGTVTAGQSGGGGGGAGLLAIYCGGDILEDSPGDATGAFRADGGDGGDGQDTARSGGGGGGGGMVVLICRNALAAFCSALAGIGGASGGGTGVPGIAGSPGRVMIMKVTPEAMV